MAQKSLDMMYNEETISQAINTKWAGKTVHFAKEIDSTNAWIKSLAKEGAEHGTLAVAEYQSVRHLPRSMHPCSHLSWDWQWHRQQRNWDLM